MSKPTNALVGLARNRFGRAAILVAASSLLVLILRLRAESVLGALFDRLLWTPALKLWADASKRPLGSVGIVVVTVIVALVAMAVVDESKTVRFVRDWWAGRASKPKPIPWEERQQIQEFRSMWHGSGDVAAEALHNWWDLVFRYVDERKYYRDDLCHPVFQYLEARTALSNLVADNSPAPLSEVQKATAVFYAEYQRLAGRILTIHRHEHANIARADGFARDCKGRADTWQSAHLKFRGDLDRIVLRPENRRLPLSPGIGLDAQVRKLLEGDPFQTTSPAIADNPETKL